MISAPSTTKEPVSPVASVSEFVLHLRHVIEAGSPLRWVGGEISNLVRAASGHIYFTLKDERAQLRCTLWRNRAQTLPFQLSEGIRVEIRGLASVYEARGDLQFSVENIRQAGLGSLYEVFLKLKAKLEAEGLFSAERKRPVPELPRGIGLVTSQAAAALHDVLICLQRRAPQLPVVLYPTRVQGDAAGEQIAQAIHTASARAKIDGIDVLIVCRGGGSMEDLWAFNHEAVARAIAQCSVPVISGVGHETDVSLADFAADLRAPTPSAAAELASAGYHALRQHLPQLQQRLQRAAQLLVQNASQRVDQLQRQLTHPRTRLTRSAEMLNRLQQRLHETLRAHQTRRHSRTENLAIRLRAQTPRTHARQTRLDSAARALARSTHVRLAQTQQQLSSFEARLAGLNPHAVLARGYAIVRNAQGGILRQASEANADEALDVQFADSHLKVRADKG